jgi:hypothetical protein
MTSRENERRRFCERARKSRVRDSGLYSLGVPASAATETCVTPTARSAMAPALGKRSRTVGGAGSGKTCVHGRRQGGYFCKECPGKGICEHGRVRSQCKACGGSGICEHGRVRSVCKECGGGGICEHGRERRRCKECGGSGICEHGRLRSRCKECGGRGICEHGRQRSQCKECVGRGICEHGRRRDRCASCRRPPRDAAPSTPTPPARAPSEGEPPGGAGRRGRPGRTGLVKNTQR